jgi:4-diphosphocytidyl-2-C-methyl-D-erythritol kinase
MQAIRALAPAKVNLYLKVLRKRPDGYHELETLFQAISLYDELLIQKARKTKLRVPGFPELERDNLILSAQRWLETHTGEKLSAEFTLDKKIPVAGGLGGGSSDAAATLIALSELFELKLDHETLHSAAKQLGADVPFFLIGGAAIGQGVGEVLTRVALKIGALLLVNPGIHVSTAEVFREFSRGLTRRETGDKLVRLIDGSGGIEDLLHNDLQQTAERLYPIISEVICRLKEAGFAKPLMSGSGPTVFAFPCEDRIEIPEKLRLLQTFRARGVDTGVILS